MQYWAGYLDVLFRCRLLPLAQARLDFNGLTTCSARVPPFPWLKYNEGIYGFPRLSWNLKDIKHIWESTWETIYLALASAITPFMAAATALPTTNLQHHWMRRVIGYFCLPCLFHLEHININVVTLQKHVYRIDQNVQVHEQGSHLTYTNLPLITGAIVCRWHGCPGWPICILRLDTTIICWIILRLCTAATGQVLWLDTCAACVCGVRLSMRAVGAGVLHLKSFTTRETLTWINLWNR